MYMYFLFRKPTGIMSSSEVIEQEMVFAFIADKQTNTAWSKLTSCVSSQCTTTNVTKSAKNGVSSLQIIGSNSVLSCLLDL